MASYLRTSLEVYNNKITSKEWEARTGIMHWNAFNAWVMVRDKNGKDYKIVIVNYFLNQ